MRDVPPWPLFYLQDSTQIEKSPDETAVSARCLISQSAAGGWRRPLPLTQHLSPLRTEHLSFLFVLSYYYYQGNFQLSSLTRQAAAATRQPVGVSHHFSDWGWSGRAGGGGGGIPRQTGFISCPVLVSQPLCEVCFYLAAHLFLFSFFLPQRTASVKLPQLRREGDAHRSGRERTGFTCQRAGPESNTMVIHESVHQTSPVISVPATKRQLTNLLLV